MTKLSWCEERRLRWDCQEDQKCHMSLIEWLNPCFKQGRYLLEEVSSEMRFFKWRTWRSHKGSSPLVFCVEAHLTPPAKLPPADAVDQSTKSPVKNFAVTFKSFTHFKMLHNNVQYDKRKPILSLLLDKLWLNWINGIIVTIISWTFNLNRLSNGLFLYFTRKRFSNLWCVPNNKHFRFLFEWNLWNIYQNEK